MSDSPTTGANAIVRERAEQIATHGYRPEDDDLEAVLAAAATYLAWGYEQVLGRDPAYSLGRLPDRWPWEPRYFRPSEEPAHTLTKAGALIAAAIDAYGRMPPCLPAPTAEPGGIRPAAIDAPRGEDDSRPELEDDGA